MPRLGATLWLSSAVLAGVIAGEAAVACSQRRPKLTKEPRNRLPNWTAFTIWLAVGLTSHYGLRRDLGLWIGDSLAGGLLSVAWLVLAEVISNWEFRRKAIILKTRWIK